MNEETVRTLLTTYVQVVIDTWPDKGSVLSSDRELPWRAICRVAGNDDAPACYEAAREAYVMISAARLTSRIEGRPWKDCLKAMVAQEPTEPTELSRLRDAARAMLKAFPPPWATTGLGGRYEQRQVKALHDLRKLVGE